MESLDIKNKNIVYFINKSTVYCPSKRDSRECPNSSRAVDIKKPRRDFKFGLKKRLSIRKRRGTLVNIWKSDTYRQYQPWRLTAERGRRNPVLIFWHKFPISFSSQFSRSPEYQCHFVRRPLFSRFACMERKILLLTFNCQWGVI